MHQCNYFVNCTKIALTRSTFFSSIYNKWRLTARFRPDPLGSLSASPNLLVVAWGKEIGTKEGRGKVEERERNERRKGGKEKSE